MVQRAVKDSEITPINYGTNVLFHIIIGYHKQAWDTLFVFYKNQILMFLRDLEYEILERENNRFGQDIRSFNISALTQCAPK
jgi:hypothetical protein